MTKPFDLADAKLGHPVQTTYGRPVAIIKFDKRGQYPIVGIITEDERESVDSWTITGSNSVDPRDACNETHGLCMAPLGTVDGREVYPGDMLLNTAEDLVPVPHGVPFDPGMWSWPAPKRNYPVTQMGAERLAQEVATVPYPLGYTAIADIVIKHGIDNGYLIDPALLDKLAGAIDDTASTPELFVDLVIKRIASLEAQVTEQARTIGAIGSERDMLRNCLQNIGTAVGLQIGHGYSEIPAAVRMREVAIARRFYTNGFIAGEKRRPYPSDDMFKAELAKVK